MLMRKIEKLQKKSEIFIFRCEKGAFLTEKGKFLTTKTCPERSRTDHEVARSLLIDLVILCNLSLWPLCPSWQEQSVFISVHLRLFSIFSWFFVILRVLRGEPKESRVMDFFSKCP